MGLCCLLLIKTKGIRMPDPVYYLLGIIKYEKVKRRVVMNKYHGFKKECLREENSRD